MASPSSSNAPYESAEIEQIITEIFAKSLHIILEARVPSTASHNSFSGEISLSRHSSSSSLSSIRPRDKWFNLALRECPDALENLELWRQSNLELMVVDVILTHRQLNHDADLSLPSAIGSLLRSSSTKDIQKEEFFPVARDKIVERWIVQYENNKSSLHGRDSSSRSKRHTGLSSSGEMSSSCKKVYKRSILLMRSLYATLRLLPAYKVYGDLCSPSGIRPFLLEHRVSSFFEPFSSVEDAEMNQFAFTTIETPCGRLSISVLYIPELDEMCSSEPSTPISAQLIPDYVGSPLAEPVKRFPSLPTPESAPSKVLFTRRHSWSIDRTFTPSVSLSPPPYSESRALHHGLPPRSHANVVNISTQRQMLRNISLPHTETTSTDEFWPSSPLPPASPSPPHLDSDFKNPLDAVSSPLGIPLVGKTRGFPNQALPPPSPKSTRQRNCNARDTGHSTSSSPDAKFQKKQEKAGPQNLQVGAAFQKAFAAFPYRKDDTANSTSCIRAAMPTARILNRVPFSKDYDDADFTCPFAIEDEDVRIDRHNETIESGAVQLSQKCNHAAVGALVRMLRDAPPLRSNASGGPHALQSPIADEGVQFSRSLESASRNLQQAKGKQGVSSSALFRSKTTVREQQGVSSSALVRSKTTVDALAELKSYKEMKNLLLGDGGLNSKSVRKLDPDPPEAAYKDTIL